MSRIPLDVARDAVTAMQAQVVGLLAAENARLAGQVTDLAARVERLASRYSGNSSMPPSAEDLPGRTPPRREQPGGGGKSRRGKQPGAPGRYLAWNDHPDDTIPHFPAGACACGADLAAPPGSGGAVLPPGHRPARGPGADRPA